VNESLDGAVGGVGEVEQGLNVLINC